MSDSLQKIIDDARINAETSANHVIAVRQLREVADRLEALQKQPVAFRHHNREDVVPASWVEEDPVFSAYTIPLIRGD